MATWLHFTADREPFFDAYDGDAPISAIMSDRSDAFTDECLFVYRDSDDALSHGAVVWARRDAVLVECDDRYVSLVQRNPLSDRDGDDPLDEYAIPLAHLAHARVIGFPSAD